MCNITFAHSGRTDSDGGHRDNKNKRGLGNYYYHCGGHPAHLHTNGVCPYSNHSAHNPKVVSSSLTPATKGYITRTVTDLVIFCCLKIGCDNA